MVKCDTLESITKRVRERELSRRKRNNRNMLKYIGMYGVILVYERSRSRSFSLFFKRRCRRELIFMDFTFIACGVTKESLVTKR
jgi:hypothetical protein